MAGTCILQHCADMRTTLLRSALFLPVAFTVPRTLNLVPLTVAGWTAHSGLIK